MVPFGERSLREEKQKEKTPAEIAAEQKQLKLQQIDALLNKLNSTQHEPTTTTATATATTTATTAAAVGATEDRKEQEESEESVEAQLMALMGLPVKGFDSTKGKEVKDGNVSGVKVATQRKFRQVMKNNKGQPPTAHPTAPHTRTSGARASKVSAHMRRC